MRLNNRIKDSSIVPLNDHHEIKPNRGHRGDHVILKRDKRARIVDMLYEIKHLFLGQPTTLLERAVYEKVDAIVKEVEK